MVRVPARVCAVALVSILGACATPGLVTYDRFDERSRTYVNDTAGFALTFGRDWRVLTDGGSTRSVGGFPVPTATEVTLRALSRGVGVHVETTRVPRGIRLDDLQPALLAIEEEWFRQLRYRQVDIRERQSHGIPYVQWTYVLQTPDVDRTVVEALFLRGAYAVRIRALANSADFESSRERIEQLLGSLTAVSDAVAPFAANEPDGA